MALTGSCTQHTFSCSQIFRIRRSFRAAVRQGKAPLKPEREPQPRQGARLIGLNGIMKPLSG